MSTTTASDYLTTPLLTSPGVPLRVAVYSRIADGIREGVFPSSTALPRETELGVALGVSRTVVREALMLLQEDGLIVTKRGVGRFVADAIPRVGLEELRALDDVLADPTADIRVRGGGLERQPGTDFATTHLALDADAEIWFRESIVLRDGDPVAIVQEYLPAGPALPAVSETLDRLLPSAAGEDSTLLSALTRRAGQIFSAGVCEIAASVAGPTRAELLEIEADAPLLLLTQTALIDGRPAYLAKCAVSSTVGHLSVRQSIPS
ncbi:GntR family transcriptional regulator [Naasia sp. SYSU D00057]|uniref:GntR family transcriptional regulator n=1 Tax=Naasia sp. SYSU D00057 TaxID=2817380 RepID=UPI001B30C940|nr:GntR family transcriptional regulator [Naasia sp. SYSU D00057]